MEPELSELGYRHRDRDHMVLKVSFWIIVASLLQKIFLRSFQILIEERQGVNIEDFECSLRVDRSGSVSLLIGE